MLFKMNKEATRPSANASLIKQPKNSLGQKKVDSGRDEFIDTLANMRILLDMKFAELKKESKFSAEQAIRQRQGYKHL